MNWEVQLREKASKILHRLPRKDEERITEIIETFGENPFSGDIVKLDSEDNLWRRRVGAYRIKFQIKTDEKIIYVYEIERRASKTY